METKTLNNTKLATLTEVPSTRIKIQIASEDKKTWYSPLVTPDCIITPDDQAPFQWIKSIEKVDVIPEDAIRTKCIKIDYYNNNDITKTQTLYITAGIEYDPLP